MNSHTNTIERSTRDTPREFPCIGPIVAICTLRGNSFECILESQGIEGPVLLAHLFPQLPSPYSFNRDANFTCRHESDDQDRPGVMPIEIKNGKEKGEGGFEAHSLKSFLQHTPKYYIELTICLHSPS